MKDKRVKQFVAADKKARKLWKKSNETYDLDKQAKLRSKAKDAYAEKEALAMLLKKTETKITKFENSFNGNFSPTKYIKTSVSPRLTVNNKPKKK